MFSLDSNNIWTLSNSIYGKKVNICDLMQETEQDGCSHKAWLRSSRGISHQTRCAILPISSLLATLGTIPVLLTRLFLRRNCSFLTKTPHNYVISNAKQPWIWTSLWFSGILSPILRKKSLVNKTGIVPSVAKSDEIGKIAHLVWCKDSGDFVRTP